MSSQVWTSHAQWKLKQYGLSKQRISRIIRHPRRTEEAILEGMVAAMQPTSEKMTPQGPQWKEEIWVMYQVKAGDGHRRIPGFALKGRPRGKHLRIISCWRYPGESPKRNPIPADILRELAGLAH